MTARLPGPIPESVDDRGVTDHHVEIVDVVVAVDSVSTVRAVAAAVYPPGVTRANWTELLDVLQGIRQDAADDRAAQLLEEQAPMFVRLGPYIRSPEDLRFIITVVIGLLALIPPAVDMVAPDAPPNVTVEVDGPSSAEVEQIVEERLRELTQSGGRLPDAEDAPPEDGAPASG